MLPWWTNGRATAPQLPMATPFFAAHTMHAQQPRGQIASRNGRPSSQTTLGRFRASQDAANSAVANDVDTTPICGCLGPKTRTRDRMNAAALASPHMRTQGTRTRACVLAMHELGYEVPHDCSCLDRHQRLEEPTRCWRWHR